jgi:predicted Zn-dependent protease
VAKPLTLIENGVLKTLLTTRTPLKNIQSSNGRARGTGPRGASANISNLFVRSRDGKSFAELKKHLIEECKKQGLSYGIIIRENNSTYGAFNSNTPLMFYKIYVEDGREELFREASLIDLSVREFRNILAAGNDPFAFNLLLNSSYNGTGTPASMVAPSVLLEETYLKKNKANKAKPKLLTQPFFSK